MASRASRASATGEGGSVAAGAVVVAAVAAADGGTTATGRRFVDRLSGSRDVMAATAAMAVSIATGTAGGAHACSNKFNAGVGGQQGGTQAGAAKSGGVK